MERVKVLYIAGFGRSGSTILANSLGQVDGFFSGGEMNFIWKHALMEDRLCGCGLHARACPVWNAVFDDAFGGMENVDAEEIMRLQHSGARTRHIPRMLTRSGRETLAGRMRKFLNASARLYESVQRVTGSRVIVDSSKEPAYGRAISMIPTVDLRVLHLVRDPRAAAYSWLKKKEQPDSEDREFMHQKSALDSAALWDVWNASTEALWRPSSSGSYMRLRYEDFIAEPKQSFQEILTFIDEPRAESPLAGEREVKLGVSHTVSGNPNRFETGSVKLRPDDRWRTEMTPKDRATVTTLTAPLLARYRYSLKATR